MLPRNVEKLLEFSDTELASGREFAFYLFLDKLQGRSMIDEIL